MTSKRLACCICSPYYQRLTLYLCSQVYQASASCMSVGHNRRVKAIRGHTVWGARLPAGLAFVPVPGVLSVLPHFQLEGCIVGASCCPRRMRVKKRRALLGQSHDAWEEHRCSGAAILQMCIWLQDNSVNSSNSSGAYMNAGVQMFQTAF